MKKKIEKSESIRVSIQGQVSCGIFDKTKKVERLLEQQRLQKLTFFHRLQDYIDQGRKYSKGKFVRFLQISIASNLSGGIVNNFKMLGGGYQ